MDLMPFLNQGGSFGAGLAVGLGVAFMVWRQLIQTLKDRDSDREAAAMRVEATVIALTSIDKTLGFIQGLVRDNPRGRR